MDGSGYWVGHALSFGEDEARLSGWPGKMGLEGWCLAARLAGEWGVHGRKPTIMPGSVQFCLGIAGGRASAGLASIACGRRVRRDIISAV